MATFEIKNLRTIPGNGSLKATFTVAFQKLELNDCKLMEGRSGLFFSPPSRKYEKGGETKYANYFYITGEDLKRDIESAAKAIYERQKPAQETRSAQTPYDGQQGNDDLDEIPF